MSGLEGHHVAARDAARAVNERTEKQMRWKEKPVELATVKAVTTPAGPLTVELFGSTMVLEEGVHLLLSQWVRMWDVNYQLMVGDALVVVRLADETYLAFDVRTDRSVDAGIRPSRPPASVTGDMRPAEGSSETGLFDVGAVGAGGGTPAVTWNHHLTHKLEVFDKDGNRVGYVPVFATLP